MRNSFKYMRLPLSSQRLLDANRVWLAEWPSRMGLSCSPILGTGELAAVSDAVRPIPGRVLVRPGERR